MPKTPPSEPSEPPEPPKRPGGARPATGAGSGARPATGGGMRPAIGGSTPSALAPGNPTPPEPGCGDRSILTFLDPGSLKDPPKRIPVGGIDPENLLTAGDAYYEGALARIGAFRAIDELIARFLGGLNLTSGNVDVNTTPTPSPGLRNKLCNYMRKKPLRLAPEDRYPVLSLFDDPMLECLLLRLADAVIAFDLSARPNSQALTPSAVPVAAARLVLFAAIEDLELFLDAKGGGGVSFVTNEVGTQLMDIIRILNDDDLRSHVPGNDVDDVFAVIAGLLAGQKEVPTDFEARQLARKASAGRRIFTEIAKQVRPDVPQTAAVDPVDPDFTDPELETLGALAYEWRAAHGCTYIEGVDDAADGQKADENRLKVLRLRPASVA
ncbi:MAG: hypothetical protein QOI98_808 [Solirubrobacteraceae bacterium]|nr:hypothetical protein [Solirubrobacteraceae bacterium]